MSDRNESIVLAKRPGPGPIDECFAFREQRLPRLEIGEMRVANLYLSVDPYLRLRMNEARSYMPPQPVGEVMAAVTVGIVEESRCAEFAPGDHVVGLGSWQARFQGAPEGFRKVDPERVPLTSHLGPLGMTGVTAWYGVNRVLEPAPRETFVVDAASGAVGSIAGQLARAAGAHVIGVAGGEDKCAYVEDDLGFDHCLDYRASGFEGALDRALDGRGIDRLFENVGGWQLDLFLARMNPFTRVALCGLIAGGYDASPMPIANANHFLTSRVRLEAFIVTDHFALWPEALSALAPLVASGAIRWRESIAEGLHAAPKALAAVLGGDKVGKQLVALTPA